MISPILNLTICMDSIVNLKINNLAFTKALTLILIFLAVPSLSRAAIVTQSKNGKVLIDNQSDEIEANQEYYLLNAEKKKVAVVRISSVKADKAVAFVIKGKSEGTESLLLKSESNSIDKVPRFQENTTNVDTNPTTTYRLSQKKISFLFNTMMSSMTALEADAKAPTPNVDSVQMKGSSTGFTAAYDRPVSSWFEFRGTLGYEPFTVAGTSAITGCDAATSRECSADISYVSAGAYARFDLYKSRTTIWFALGSLGKFPYAKKTTALKTEDLKLAGAYSVAAGLEFFLNNKFFLPLSVEQQYFISTETVKANQLSIRTGLGIAY